MVSFTSQSLFLMKAAAFVVVSIGMLTAYFAIGRTRHFLHWLLYVLFLGAALLLPSDSELPAAVTVLRTVLMLASVSSFVAGCQLFRGGRYSRREALALSVYSTVYVLALTILSAMPAWRPYGDAVISLFIAFGHGMGSWFLSRPVIGRKTLAERFALVMNDIVMLSWAGRGILILTGRDNGHPVLVLGAGVPTLLFALIIFSQERTWQRAMNIEAMLEMTALQHTASSVYSALIRRIRSPIGNINLALSHIEHEEDPDRRMDLVRGALKNTKSISSDLMRYERLSGRGVASERGFTDIRQLLETVTEVISLCDGCSRIGISLDAGRISDSGRLFEIRQDILFHGILSILVGAADHDTGGERTITISTRTEKVFGGDRLQILFSGLDLPVDLLGLNRDVLDAMNHGKALRLASAKSALLAIEAGMDAVITLAAEPPELVISLGRRPEPPSSAD